MSRIDNKAISQDDFERCLRRHQPSLLRFFSRSGLAEVEREDALQDVFSVFAKRYTEVHHEAQFHFLKTTALRVLAARRRSRWNEIIFCKTANLSEGRINSSIEDLIDQKRNQAHFLEALVILPAHDQALFIASRIHHQTREQIAEALKLKEGTVATQLAKTDSRLLAILDRLRRFPTVLSNSNHFDFVPTRNDSAHFGILKNSHPWATFQVGDFTYVNNQWGRGRARGQFEQSFMLQSFGKKIPGFSWNWPNGFDGPYGFPMAHLGWSPWLGGPVTPQRLPYPIARIKKFDVEYKVRASATGPFALFLVLFIVDEPRYDGAVDPTKFSGEILVILDQKPEFITSCPEYTGNFGGSMYKIWKELRFGGKELSGFPSFVFQQFPRKSSGSIDLYAMLSYLKAKRLLNHQHLATCINFGIEIWGGAGKAWVDQLTCEIVTE
jgi:RNA polymerase sigma factor (sigma-70 family)